MTGAPLALLVLFALAGCAREPGTYDIAPRQALGRLAASRLEPMIEAERCGVPVSVEVAPAAGSRIVWRVASDGMEFLRLTATVAAAGAGRSRVSLAAGDAVFGARAYDGHRFYPIPVLGQPVLPALAEQVAALLEGRAFDPAALPRPGDLACAQQRQLAHDGETLHAWAVVYDHASGTWINAARRTPG